jgi:ribosomal protein L40E
MAVRNPVLAVLATFVATTAIVPLFLLAVLGLRLLSVPADIVFLCGVAAVAIAGFLAGRSGAFAFTAFPVSFVGGFAGYALFASFANPPLGLLGAAFHATVTAVAAWASATRHMGQTVPEVRLENEDKRRCRMCGVRVGPKARRCWSCRASLNRIT